MDCPKEHMREAVNASPAAMLANFFVNNGSVGICRSVGVIVAYSVALAWLHAQN